MSNIKKELKELGYKVVEINMSNPMESIYAVCTPIQKQ